MHTDESERSLAETASIEEGVLYGSSVELRQSHKKVSTLKRKSNGGALKPPPRPTPGSVTYTDDESDKAYDHNPDESSLTEKPSEISSSDSQVHKNNNKNSNPNADSNGRCSSIAKNYRNISSLSTFLSAHSPSPASPSPNPQPVIQYLPKISTVFQVSSSTSPQDYSKLEQSYGNGNVNGLALGQRENSSSPKSTGGVAKCWKIVDNACYCSAASCCSNALKTARIFPLKNTQK